MRRKSTKTAIQPSHPISQRITVSAIYAAHACVCARASEGEAHDKRSVLSILSRRDVLKGILLLINSWEPKEKGTFCGFAKIIERKKKWWGGCALLVSILLDTRCARRYVLIERHIISGQLSYLLFTALWETLVARRTAVTYNISRSNGAPIHVQKKP